MEILTHTKFCKKCKKVQELHLFQRDRTKKDGRRTICNTCVKKYLAETREIRLAKKKAYRKNPEVKEREKRIRNEYRKNNALMLRLKRQEYRKRKLAEGYIFKPYKGNKRYKPNRERSRKHQMYMRLFSPEYKIKKNLRIRLNKALKGKLKKSSAFRDLGMDMETFMKYIESLFYGDMTWENYGDYWDLDHIRPLSSFDLLDEFQLKQASHYSNIQPLTKKHNSIKKGRILTPEQNELLKKDLINLKEV